MKVSSKIQTNHPKKSFAKHAFCILESILLLLLCTACAPKWETTLQGADGTEIIINHKTLASLNEFSEEYNGESQIPMEFVLLRSGYEVIERLSISDLDEQIHTFDWPAVAGNTWWLNDGRLLIADEEFKARQISVVSSALLSDVQARITDIAPTAATALGIAPPAQATGQDLGAPEVDHVLLLFLDGFGYIRYGEALRAGLIPFMASLDAPLLALTSYPPCTSVATASVLTGASPDVHGANRRGIRKTETETLFDVAGDAGLSVEAIEGNALAFNLRGVELQLSGDRDASGGTDDNVIANARAALTARGMPDLFWVHFHGIDDAGHTYGPGAPEEEAKIQEVDGYVAELIEALPNDTLIIIFADHGMHQVNEDGRLGNHGNLVARDMFIPIWLLTK